MSNKKTVKNNDLLTIRLPAELMQQLESLAQTKYMGVSTMARLALVQYLNTEAPKALLGITPQPQAKGKPLQDWEKAMSPAQRKKMEDDYDEAWG